uniref:Lipocalin n=1 Tax=Rhipicephalus zambeziensis TaxID=60191 RepID=A0A224YE12_9ACAR
MKYCILELCLRHGILIAVSMFLCLKANTQALVSQVKKTDSDTALSIVEVFNTTQRLWLYQKNYTDDVDIPENLSYLNLHNLDLTLKCTFIKKHNITESEFHFWWKTMMLEEWVSSRYYGTFLKKPSDAPLGSMNVVDVSGNETKPFETMKLMYRETNCSVFFIKPLTGDADEGCEMYVRNKAVSYGPPDNCLYYYNTFCKNTTVVYNSTCQSLLQTD